ncbi:lipopolysaccharide biosynthesis protein [Acidobacteriota bacterium]
MQKRQILINAIMSVVQILVISTVLFILYRYLLIAIGIKQLGIWSLVLSTTSVTQIANLGLSGSVVKFVAKYIARGENEKVSEVIQTAALSVAGFVGLFLLLSYPLAKQILGLIVTEESLPSALAILPYAFLALWIMVITSVFQSGLDGYQRIDLRNLILMGGALFHLLLCFVLVPAHGLMGLAYARIIQNSTILVSSWVLIKKIIPTLPAIPYKWSKKQFKEIFNYGLNFQLISLSQMFYDPTTKALLAKFGGLSMVGYYEMASKLVLQLRTLIISANQVIVPAIADLKERGPEKIHMVYLKSYRLFFYLAFPLLSILIVGIPLISELWIGRYERQFVVFGMILAIGWFINALGGPAYFAYLGIGRLRWNVISHVVIAMLNAGLGFIFGKLYGGFGVVLAWALSLILGGIIIYSSYHISYKIPFTELLPKASRVMITTCLFGILLAITIRHNLDHNINAIVLESLILLSFSLIVFIPFWRHPMRKRLKEWVKSDLLKTSPHD